MTGKGFCVKFQLDLHAITCPGVWLCPNGKVALRVDCLESCLESTRVAPIFPLLYHNKLIFQKIFTGINTLIELQHCLQDEPFYAELLQWSNKKCEGVVLATFFTNLAEILYPEPHCKGLLSGVEVDLLMDRAKTFPGIIAPKIEVSTKTIVEEIVGICGNRNSLEMRTINPKTISSKGHYCKDKSNATQKQRKVCHSQGIKISQRPRCTTYQPSNYATSTNCSLAVTKAKIIPCFPKSGKHFSHYPECSEDCSVCSKYRQYFSNNCEERTFANCRCNLKPECTSEESLISKIEEHPCSSHHLLCDDDHPTGCLTTKDQEYYKNLERFYKKMYKHAKMRAESGGCG